MLTGLYCHLCFAFPIFWGLYVGSSIFFQFSYSRSQPVFSLPLLSFFFAAYWKRRRYLFPMLIFRSLLFPFAFYFLLGRRMQHRGKNKTEKQPANCFWRVSQLQRLISFVLLYWESFFFFFSKPNCSLLCAGSSNFPFFLSLSSFRC